jgi:fucose permease
MNDLIKVRKSLFGCFLIIGLLMSSWIVRTPSVRDALGASTAEMGLVLFGLSVGSMTGILQAGGLVRRFGTRRVISVGLAIGLGGLVLMAIGTQLSMPILVAAGLCCVGLGMAASEVGVNVEGAIVERELGRSVLPLVHGCFSLGTVIGALFGMLMAAFEVPVAWHLAGAGVVLAPFAALVVQNLSHSPPPAEDDDDHRQGFFATMMGDAKLLMIGTTVLGMALAEGAANDWLPLLMVDAHGLPEGNASMVFVGFATMMTIGRFLGPTVLHYVEPITVIRMSALAGGAGVAVVVFSDSALLAGLAVLLWGFGASLGFPVAMSAAGNSTENAAARVSAVATLGYVAFLVGPPALGQVGEHFGLRNTMLIVLLLLIPCFIFSPAFRQGARAKPS